MYGCGGGFNHGSCAALVILECGHCAQRRLTVAIVTAGSVDIRVFVKVITPFISRQDGQGPGAQLAIA